MERNIRKVTINAHLRSFQYKILNNKRYVNKKLRTFGLSNTQLCYFCNMEEKTTSHLFCYCTHIQDNWNQVQTYFTDCFHFSQLTSQADIFGFHTSLIQNHLLLSLNYSNYIYTMSQNTDFYLLTFF